MFGFLYTKFRIKVIYKSGATHQFWTYSFAKTRSGYEWHSCSDANKPFLLGPDEIAAVYQTGYKRRPFTK